jgi:CPA2 family monovalent cation:H+ antiporter-2
MIAGTKNRELFLLSVVFIAFAIAWLTSKIGLSLALGAFLAGLMIAESQYSHNAISHILPFRDIFMSFFFVSIGMLLNLNTVIQYYPYIIGFFILLLLVKTITASFAALLLKYPLAIALMVGFSLAQIGEFSFILAKTGKSFDLIDQTAYQLFLAVAVLSMLVTPFLINLGQHAEKISRWVPLPKRIKQRRFDTKNKPPRLTSHLIIVGYGLNGKNLAHAAQIAKLPFLIVDLNPDTVNRERKAGLPIYFGDAGHTAVMEELHAAGARALIIAGPDIATTRRIVFLAKLQNPDIYIIARTRFVSEIEPLRELGADEVIAEEFESAIEIFTRVLALFNIPGSQINALSQGVRAEGYSELRTEDWACDKLEDLNLPDMDIKQVTIPDNSIINSKSIHEIISSLNYKINILAIRRYEETIQNPYDTEILQDRDNLVIYANPADIEQFVFDYSLTLHSTA